MKPKRPTPTSGNDEDSYNKTIPIIQSYQAPMYSEGKVSRVDQK
jgi:hypothetical protein